MPVLKFKCTDENCGLKVPVIAGLYDASAICSRLDEELFTLYFEVSNFKEA